MELKTLKDIGKTERKCCSIEKDYNNVCEKCIKKEAIKWAKNTIKAIKKYGNPKVNTTGWCGKQAMKTQLHFIKYFFNLNEEYLL